MNVTAVTARVAADYGGWIEERWRPTHDAVRLRHEWGTRVVAGQRRFEKERRDERDGGDGEGCCGLRRRD
jgi:hypothetical protein